MLQPLPENPSICVLNIRPAHSPSFHTLGTALVQGLQHIGEVEEHAASAGTQCLRNPVGLNCSTLQLDRTRAHSVILLSTCARTQRRLFCYLTVISWHAGIGNWRGHGSIPRFGRYLLRKLSSKFLFYSFELQFDRIATRPTATANPFLFSGVEYEKNPCNVPSKADLANISVVHRPYRRIPHEVSPHLEYRFLYTRPSTSPCPRRSLLCSTLPAPAPTRQAHVVT